MGRAAISEKDRRCALPARINGVPGWKSSSSPTSTGKTTPMFRVSQARALNTAAQTRDEVLAVGQKLVDPDESQGGQQDEQGLGHGP